MALEVQAGQEGPDGLGIADVQGLEAGRDGQGFQEAPSLFGGLSPAGQDQSLRAFFGKPAGDPSPQGSQASRQQDGTLDPGGGKRGRGRFAPDQPGSVAEAVAPGDLGFGVPGRDLGQQPEEVLFGGVRVQVDQSARKLGVLVEEGPPQAPEGSLEGVGLFALDRPGSAADQPDLGRGQLGRASGQGAKRLQGGLQPPFQARSPALFQGREADHPLQVRDLREGQARKVCLQDPAPPFSQGPGQGVLQGRGSAHQGPGSVKARRSARSRGWLPGHPGTMEGRAQWLEPAGSPRSRSGGPSRRRRREVRGSLLEDHVDVGPSQAEGADPGDPGSRLPRPVLRPGGHPQVLPGGARGGTFQVQVGRQPALLQGQHGLEQSGHAGGGFGVAQVALDRADPKGMPRRPGAAQHRVQGSEFDGVSQGGAGSVGLDVVNLGGVQSGPGQGLEDHRLLGCAAGRGQAVAAPILVHRAAADHGPHRIGVAPGRIEGLEQDHPAALAAHEAVGLLAEAVTDSGGREGPQIRRGFGTEDQVHAARQGQGGFALTQGLAGQVDGQERGGAGRVHNQAGTLQAQGIGDPPGCHAVEQARGVPGALRPPLADQGGVVVAGDPDEDPDASPLQLCGIEPGRGQGLPGGLQQEAVLGVHQLGFGGVDPEELGGEEIHPRKEPSHQPGQP